MESKLSIVRGAQSTFDTNFIHRIFEENLKTFSENQVALIYDGVKDNVRDLSYDSLNKTSNRLASCILQNLHETNAKPNQDGDYIIVACMANHELTIATLLAIWKAGAAYLPIDPTYPTNRIAHIINESKPVMVIYDRSDDLSVFQNANLISFSDLMSKSIGCKDETISAEAALNRNTDDVAIVLYTSGSTGTPKGVRLTHTSILNKLRSFWHKFPFSNTEKVTMLNSALGWVVSIAELWGSLLKGHTVLLIPQEVTKDPSQMVDLLEKYEVERLVLVPTLLASLLMYMSLQSESHLNSLKTWMCCGETLMTSLAQEFHKYFRDGTHILYNLYGCSETTGENTYFVANTDQLNGMSKVPIGNPLENTTFLILDENMELVKSGESGELYVCGLGVAKGYVNGREKSRFIFNRFTDNPKFDRLYRTGDFATVSSQGCIQYEGRMDSQIKVRGNRVDISEVEKVLRSIEDVKKGVVLCYHVGEIDQALLAFVTLTSGYNQPSQQGLEVENILKTKLIDYQLPHVLVIESIPLLANGKIDRQKLLKMYENNDIYGESKFDYTGIPEDKLNMAKDVFEIISKVIGRSARSTISVTNNFYELGGDSLNSVFTVTKLREKGYFISVTDFVTAHSLEEILSKITLDGMVVEENQMKLKAIPLTAGHKTQAISLLAASFYEKSDLTKYLMPHILLSDVVALIEHFWDSILEENLSFAITDMNDNMLGVTTNKDIAFEYPPNSMKCKLMVIIDFMESVEQPVIEKEFPRGLKKILHALLMGTSLQLTPAENVIVIQKMEEENIILAKNRGFAGILATPTSPLTQQFGTHIYGYRTLLDCQINKYVHHDGSVPFAKAPDSQRAIVQYKELRL